MATPQTARGTQQPPNPPADRLSLALNWGATGCQAAARKPEIAAFTSVACHRDWARKPTEAKAKYRSVRHSGRQESSTKFLRCSDWTAEIGQPSHMWQPDASLPHCYAHCRRATRREGPSSVCECECVDQILCSVTHHFNQRQALPPAESSPVCSASHATSPPCVTPLGTQTGIRLVLPTIHIYCSIVNTISR